MLELATMALQRRRHFQEASMRYYFEQANTADVVALCDAGGRASSYEAAKTTSEAAASFDNAESINAAFGILKQLKPACNSALETSVLS